MKRVNDYVIMDSKSGQDEILEENVVWLTKEQDRLLTSKRRTIFKSMSQMDVFKNWKIQESLTGEWQVL